MSKEFNEIIKKCLNTKKIPKSELLLKYNEEDIFQIKSDKKPKSIKSKKTK